MSQLALPIKLNDHAVFETFWAAGNEGLLDFLHNLCEEQSGPGVWIWGTVATGKSHLLQAICERSGERSAFLPLADLGPTGPGILDGMAERTFVCLDDLDAVSGDAEWERGLFGLFEQAAASNRVLVASSSGPPRDSGFSLPDLKSRFSLLPAFRLRPLDEKGRHNALKLRARHRGLELPDETARFLTNHSRRDMASLYALLDKLDGEALAAKRRLTVPFVREVIGR